LGAAIIYKYFPDLSERQKSQIEQLHSMYTAQNKKVNVISRKDIDQLYERHVLHSLAIARFIRFKPETSILDLGTGGGFPGIPLAILFPRVSFHLVDSTGRKVKVVNEVSSALRLGNVTTSCQRIEEFRGTFDFIVARAVAKTKQLFMWAHQRVSTVHGNDLENGLILLKGGDLTKEMKEFGRLHSEVSLSDYFEEAFFKMKKIIYAPVSMRRSVPPQRDA